MYFTSHFTSLGQELNFNTNKKLPTEKVTFNQKVGLLYFTKKNKCEFL